MRALFGLTSYQRIEIGACHDGFPRSIYYHELLTLSGQLSLYIFRSKYVLQIHPCALTSLPFVKRVREKS